MFCLCWPLFFRRFWLAFVPVAFPVFSLWQGAKNAPQPEKFVFLALFQASEIRCFLLRFRTKTNSSHALIFHFPRHAFFFNFGLQNGAKTTPESSSRRLQERPRWLQERCDSFQDACQEPFSIDDAIWAPF